VSLSLGPDERVSVIGPNGAGKTTLFRLIAGEMRPTSGSISLFGRDTTSLPAYRRARLGLARTFQVSNLFLGLSVAENVRLATQAVERDQWRFWSPMSRADPAAERARTALEQAQLERRSSDRVADLSHGEQRQLEVAMALATEPRLLLLDEPAAGLARNERTRLMHLLQALPRSIPLLLIEHDMALAMGLADRVVCLHNGRTVASGAPADVRADASVQAIYLGREPGRA